MIVAINIVTEWLLLTLFAYFSLCFYVLHSEKNSLEFLSQLYCVYSYCLTDMGMGDNCPYCLDGGLVAALVAAQENSGSLGSSLSSLQCGAAHSQEKWLCMFTRPGNKPLKIII